MPAISVAKQWFEYSVGGHQSEPRFFEFLTTWIAFNALYSSCPGHDEKARVKNFATTELHVFHRTLMDTNADYRTAIEYLCDNPIRNVRKNEIVDIPDPSEVGNIGYVLYVIRCNLVHGDKTPESWRDQIVVRHAMVILGSLLSGYLESRNA